MPSCPSPRKDVFGPLKLSGPQRAGILSDIHVPYHDRRAIEIAVRHLKKLKIDTLILNGDIADAPGLSRYLKDPSVVQLKHELKTLRQMFAWLRSEFPKAEIVWKLGNHEARLYSYLLSNAPALFDLEVLTWGELARCNDHGIRVMEDDTRIIHLGKLPVVHGHEFIRSFAPPVSAARGLFLRTHTSALCGHHHTTSTHPDRDVKGRPIMTWSTGCLCKLTPRYSRFNKWNHGFAAVEVYRGGGYDVSNLRILDGRVS